MKNKARSLFNWIKLHYIWSIIILIVLIIVATKVFGANGNGNIETITIQPQEFLRTVEVAGKVTPANDVELGFETTGRITAVYKKEGDRAYAGETLATLSSGNEAADILKAQADLDAEIARLNELKSNTGGSGTITASTRRELFEAMSDAYTRSDDAVRNSVDQVYRDGEIVFAFDNYELKQELNKARRTIETTLNKWKEMLDAQKDSTFTDAEIGATENYLQAIKNFLERVSLAVNDFSEERSSYTDAEIAGFRADVSNARSSINTAISNLVAAKESVRDIESEIPYQEARVKAAQATVRSFQSEAAKRVITAPFTGVVTQQDARVGQIVSANTVVMRLISDAKFTIETFVPEINIKEVAVGNIAKVTLDAYGDDEVFDAKVISIDPGETIRGGVSTYKVLFQFMNEDERFKSGMTANVVITTDTKPNALLVPQESIIRRDGFTYVQVLVGKEKVEKQVTTGGVASNGYIEIVAGLSEGEVVVKNAQ